MHVLLSYAMKIVHFMSVYTKHVNYNDDNKLRLQKGEKKFFFHICRLSLSFKALGAGSKLECYDLANELSPYTLTESL